MVSFYAPRLFSLRKPRNIAAPTAAELLFAERFAICPRLLTQASSTFRHHESADFSGKRSLLVLVCCILLYAIKGEYNEGADEQLGTPS